jgi:Multiubiquitin
MVEKLTQKERDIDSVESDRRDAGDGRAYQFKLGYEGATQTRTTNDRIVDGRKIMRLGDIESADDHVLIELKRPGSRSVGLDEDVDLGEPGREEFRAFTSDRVFNFTVDRLGYEWGAARISEPELRDIAGVPEGKVLVLEREDEPDDVIEPDQIVDLGERGTEHIRIENHPDTFEIKVIYNGVEKKLKVSLSELIGQVLQRAVAAFGNPPNPHLLSLYNKAGRELPEGETVQQAKVKKGDKLLLRPSAVKAG